MPTRASRQSSARWPDSLRNLLRSARGWLAIALLASLAAASGCSTLSLPKQLPWHKVPLDASTGFYQTASLVYRLDAGKLQQPMDVARVDGQRVSYEQLASSPQPGESLGTLSITFPHPGGRVGYAQARFVLNTHPKKTDTKTKWNPFAKSSASEAAAVGEFHEEWELDLANAESDEYFKVLSRESFYNTERMEKDSLLTVTINGKRVEKHWQQVPELNTLVQRVRREGQLVAYAHPAAPTGTAGAIAGLKAYDQLLAQTGTGQPLLPGPVSAFAVPLAPATAVPSVMSAASPAQSPQAVGGLPGMAPARR